MTTLDSFTNLELDQIASKLKIKNYIPCRMKNELVGKQASEVENGIIGSNNSDESDTANHWTLYYKDNDKRIYYSSFGDHISNEIKNYLGTPIKTSDIQIQSLDGIDQQSCGAYCLIILYLLSNDVPFEDIIIFLIP